jgi:hypothetical protein
MMGSKPTQAKYVPCQHKRQSAAVVLGTKDSSMLFGYASAGQSVLGDDGAAEFIIQANPNDAVCNARIEPANKNAGTGRNDG